MSISIYRFNFCSEVMDLITQFAKIHQFDDRKVYKELWVNWMEENNDSITNEITRLRRLGYEGDILDKMFKAGRYYFRKKNTNEEKQQQKRRSYITMSSDVLNAMDKHIYESIKNDDFTPSSGYTDFCTTHVEILKSEIKRLCSETVIESSDLIEKIKKTYKNRYFIVTRKI